jgi:MutS domain V
VTTPDPGAAYGLRLGQRRSATAGWKVREGRCGSARLWAFAIAVVLLFSPGGLSAAWSLVPLAGFIALVVVHLRASRSRQRSRRAEAFYERGLARLQDRWVGTGSTGDRFRDDAHPYERDLDLFGRGSLFELLCTARTGSGERALAARLSAPASIPDVRESQTAVQELTPRLDLREEIAILGDEVSIGVHAEGLAAWGAAPIGLTSRTTPVVAAALSVITVTGCVLWSATDLGAWPFTAGILLEVLFFIRVRRGVQEVLAGVDRPAAELDLLARLLERVENEPFEAPRLVRLRQELDTAGQPPSRSIARLRLLVQLVDARRNQLFAPISGMLMWGTQLAFAIERWRATSGAAVGRWLSALGEFEALLSLASHAHEHPDDPYPELVDDGPCLEGKALGHPLLSAEQCVENDVRFADGLQLFLVSGSNMSGKSTWLRTVGTNTVLALAGAPVRAGSLRISRLQVAASMRSQDSLLDGRSRFYAEIERIKQVMDLAEGDVPALFLLDELLHGTNSHDRAIGAAAVVRELVGRGALGLVTTHDLTLAGIVESLGASAINVHFEDHLEEGKMVFDYRLQPGVVTKSNALDLMRAIGLDV